MKSRSAPPSGAKHLGTEVGSIFVFAGAVFALFALWTYYPQDPSLFSNGAEAARNACGKVGAYLSSLMLECFGLGAFILPASLGFIAAAIYRREGRVRLIGTLGGMTVCVMSLTVFLTLQWKYWPYAGTLLLTGGAFGAWSSELLTHQFNALGSSIVSLLIFCIALVVSTPVSVAEFGAKMMGIAGAAGRVIFLRWGRVLVTYLAYLLGLLAMRILHASGDLMQKMIEGALNRARERAKAAKAQKALAAAQGADPRLESGKKAEIEVLSAPTEDDSDSDESGADISERVKKGKKPQIQAQLPLPEIAESDIVSASEAPNVLPELEKEGPSLAPQAAPAILPIEETGAAAIAAGEPPSGATAAGSPRMGRGNPGKIVKPPKKRGQWKLPIVDFLSRPPKVETNIDRDKLIEKSQILRQKFLDFGIEGEVTAVRPGPVITLYEFKPGPGVKVSRIASMADDISMALSAQSVRIIAPLPGKSVVGIEIPSDVRETVYLREFLQHADFHGPKHSIPVVMGKDIGGAPVLSDLARMPHLLAAGQTGAGKSVFMNGLICSLLYRFTPDEMRMILIDPKFVEFRSYLDLPHLLLPVVDDPTQASIALKWAVREMERRYRLIGLMGARNLAALNQKIEDMGGDVVREFLLSEENQPDPSTQVAGSDWLECFEADEQGSPRIAKLPYIVIIIDELADLMMTAKKDVEISINRIAQKARAAGIHLVIATQRPSTDVVTGLIKANLPTRVSFRQSSLIDSRTILDRQGAERLLGQGDMLFIPPGVSDALRLHGAWVSDDEINKITAFIKEQGAPVYRNEILVEEQEDGEGEDSEENEDDELFQQAIQLVKHSGHASASFLQRHLGVGYNRAARMIETMELRGVVGPANGSKPREVLVR